MRKAEDFATWYPEAIVAGEFISYYDVSGALLPRIMRSVTALHAEASKAQITELCAKPASQNYALCDGIPC